MLMQSVENAITANQIFTSVDTKKKQINGYQAFECNQRRTQKAL